MAGVTVRRVYPFSNDVGRGDTYLIRNCRVTTQVISGCWYLSSNRADLPQAIRGDYPRDRSKAESSKENSPLWVYNYSTSSAKKLGIEENKGPGLDRKARQPEKREIKLIVVKQSMQYDRVSL